MNILDTVLGILVLAVAVTQAVRGFGRAVWDALLLLGALALAQGLSPQLGGGAAAYGALLLVFGVLAFLLSRMLYAATQWHAGTFHGLLGLAAGLAAGVMLAHGMVQTVAATGEAGRAQIAESKMGTEMLSFPTYHATLEGLQSETLSQRALPDVEH